MDWQEPTEEEKRAIHNPLDIPIIAVIKGLTCEDRKLIYDSIAVKTEYESHFMKTQEPWIEDFKKYWGENHHQNPSDSLEFGTDFINSREYERFRLYYAAKHPDRIEIKHINRKTLDFFVETEEFLRIENLILSTTK